jgi:uncharacterized YigZ family protein
MSETLLARAGFELEVKKSRFLVHAAPVDSPEAALAFLGDVSNCDATHNCWAYRIGQAYRFSDDGEPAGTAGKPILAAIDGQKLDGVMAVVTRWYGGIKLGAGGLVRAYGGSAAECLRRAPRRTVIEYVDATLEIDFAHAATLHALLAQSGAEKLDESYAAEGLVLHLRVPAENADALDRSLRNATRGKTGLARDRPQ